MKRSRWWGISAFFGYNTTLYSEEMQEIDRRIVQYAGDLMKGATIIEPAAGGGRTSIEAIVNGGASRAILIENNPGMNRAAKRLAKSFGVWDSIDIVARDMYDGIIPELVTHRPNIFVFKRCLYYEALAQKLLDDAYAILEPGGLIFVIHGEKDKALFDSDGQGNIKKDHRAKRRVNRLGDLNPNHHHDIYYAADLIAMCRGKKQHRDIQVLEAPYPAYNFLVIRKPFPDGGLPILGTLNLSS